MIPRFWRVIVYNDSGQTVSYDTNGRFNVKVTGVHIDPTTLKVTYTQLTDDDCSFVATSTVADGGEVKTDEIDNASSSLYIGLIIQVEVTHDAGSAADGAFHVFFDGGEATAQLASDAAAYDDAKSAGLQPLGTVPWSSSYVDDELARSRNFYVGVAG
jgi:hypothetical protein